MACSPRLVHRTSVAPPPAASSSPVLSVGNVCSAPSAVGWTIQYKQPGQTLYGRSHAQSFIAFARADLRRRWIQLNQAPQGRRSSGQEVVMVDPLEAKRLAVKQMEGIRAREKLKRDRQAEAINGALAMFGLTVALILEGQTGKSIQGQLAGYLAAVSSLFGL